MTLPRCFDSRCIIPIRHQSSGRNAGKGISSKVTKIAKPKNPQARRGTAIASVHRTVKSVGHILSISDDLSSSPPPVLCCCMGRVPFCQVVEEKQLNDTIQFLYIGGIPLRDPSKSIRNGGEEIHK